MYPLGHAPWLGEYVFRIPAIAAAGCKMFQDAEARAIKRTKSGAIKRDVFYYLVRDLHYATSTVL